MKKLFFRRILPAVFGAGLIITSIFAFSSCGSYYGLNCDVTCPSSSPYWGGGDYCYEYLSDCEYYYDVCWDCSE